MIGRDFPGIDDPFYGLSDAERQAWVQGGAKGLLSHLVGAPKNQEAPVEQELPSKHNANIGSVPVAGQTVEAPATLHEVRTRLMKMSFEEFAVFMNEISYAITRLMDDRRAAIAMGMMSDSSTAGAAVRASNKADAADRTFRQSIVVQAVRQEVQRRFNATYETGAHNYPGWCLEAADREKVKAISANGDDREQLAPYGITGKFADGVDPVAVFIRDYRERA
jgi:hypothetical protein